MKNQIRPTIQEIFRIVCEYHNATPEEAGGKTRKRKIVEIRQQSYYFCRKYTREGTESIGKAIGNKDHVTVLYSYEKVRNYIETDKTYRARIEEIEEKILKHIEKKNQVLISQDEIIEEIREKLLTLLLRNYPKVKEKAKKYDELKTIIENK
jgi:hypothetical protein